MQDAIRASRPWVWKESRLSQTCLQCHTAVGIHYIAVKEKHHASHWSKGRISYLVLLSVAKCSMSVRLACMIISNRVNASYNHRINSRSQSNTDMINVPFVPCERTSCRLITGFSPIVIGSRVVNSFRVRRQTRLCF